MEKEEFDRLLKTSRIELDAEEAASIEKDIEEILKFFDTLEDVSLNNEKLAFHPVEIPEKLRDDSTQSKDQIENVFYNGDNYRFYFLGPRI
ncbi:MAG: Asp-tRNA(Asn)/Glu-tRNA(Gln) amidotransferase subunit GatC [Candidatus Parvarchaeum sp.]